MIIAKLFLSFYYLGIKILGIFQLICPPKKHNKKRKLNWKRRSRRACGMCGLEWRKGKVTPSPEVGTWRREENAERVGLGLSGCRVTSWGRGGSCEFCTDS